MDRFYRQKMGADDLVFYNIVEQQTDLYIGTPIERASKCAQIVSSLRNQLTDYIKIHPLFAESFDPIMPLDNAPEIAVRMCEAADAAGVGPMAAVAGAISQMLGNALSDEFDNIIIENGGDLFIKTNISRIIEIYAGESFKGNLRIEIRPEYSPLSVCTSSGKFGHSISLGKADSATVIANDAFIADAAATALGNHVLGPNDIESALNFAISLTDVLGAIVVCDGKLGAIGNVKFC